MGNGDTFDWIGAQGATWNSASNWYDETTGTAATRAPGAADQVQFESGADVVSGGGTAYEIYILNDAQVTLEGTASYSAVVTDFDSSGSLSLVKSSFQGVFIDVESGATFDVSQGAVETGANVPLETQPIVASFDSMELSEPFGGYNAGQIILGKSNIGLNEFANDNDGLGNAYAPGVDITTTGGSFYMTPGTGPAPTFSTTSIDFGIIHLGQQASQSLTLTNTGSEMDGTFKTTGIVNTNLSATPQDFSLDVGDSSTFTVSATGNHLGSLAGNTVQITGQFGFNGSPAGNTFGQTMLVPITGQVVNYANPTFMLYTNDPNAVQSNTAPGHHLINLGNVTQGAVLGAMYLVVGNAVSGPSDTVTATSADTASRAFTESHHLGISGLQAGASAVVEQINLNTSITGAATDTIVQEAYGSNASGYVGSMQLSYTTVVANIVPHG